jgi:hypothetical protein
MAKKKARPTKTPKVAAKKAKKTPKAAKGGK